jgi:hypothetical protein
LRWALIGAGWDVLQFPWKVIDSTRGVMNDGIHDVEAVKITFTRSVQAAGLTSLLITLESLDENSEVVDSDTQLIDGATREATTDLLVKQGAQLRYRYRLNKIVGNTSETLESTEQRERTIFVQI